MTWAILRVASAGCENHAVNGLLGCHFRRRIPKQNPGLEKMLVSMIIELPSTREDG